MSIGDVYVTATLLLVLGATLIVGNIIADMLLGAPRPARAAVGGLSHVRRLRPAANRRSTSRCRTTCLEGIDTRTRTTGATSQSFAALVWRRLRRSIPGMLGLVLVCLLLFVSVFAYFFAPVDPKAQNVAFAPPDKISFYVPGSGLALLPVVFPTVETDELDPITFQPLIGPGLREPAPARLLREGLPLHALRHPDASATSSARSTARRSTSSAPTSSAATSSPAASSARRSRCDRADLDRAHHHHRHPGRHRLGLHRRPLRQLAAALRGDHPRLPAAAALPRADHADPGDSAVEPLPHLRRPGHRRPRLGAAGARGARQDHGAGPRRLRPRRAWRSAPATGGSSAATSCPT